VCLIKFIAVEPYFCCCVWDQLKTFARIIESPIHPPLVDILSVLTVLIYITHKIREMVCFARLSQVYAICPFLMVKEIQDIDLIFFTHFLSLFPSTLLVHHTQNSHVYYRSPSQCATTHRISTLFLPFTQPRWPIPRQDTSCER
jgi:hypothetical protein